MNSVARCCESELRYVLTSAALVIIVDLVLDYDCRSISGNIFAIPALFTRAQDRIVFVLVPTQPVGGGGNASAPELTIKAAVVIPILTPPINH